MTDSPTPWLRGRFDALPGPRKLLFGRMYEDAQVEACAFVAPGRVFCIASAGDTALALSARHEVVAADINPVQIEYARARFAGGAVLRGTAERVLDFGRTLAPLAGWGRRRVREFLDLDDPALQLEVFREQLDTRRFRLALAALFSVLALRAVYAPPFLDFLPARLGAVFRRRMERCFARHPNRANPYARALFLGDVACERPAGADPSRIQLVCADAARFLEGEPPASFDGFTLSNVLDGAPQQYRERLFAAVRRAAAPGALVVLRSFAEPSVPCVTNRAADDRSMLWGVADVRPASALES